MLEEGKLTSLMLASSLSKLSTEYDNCGAEGFLFSPRGAHFSRLSVYLYFPTLECQGTLYSTPTVEQGSPFFFSLLQNTQETSII